MECNVHTGSFGDGQYAEKNGLHLGLMVVDVLLILLQYL